MAETRSQGVAWVALLLAAAALGLAAFAKPPAPRDETPVDDDSDLLDRSSLDGRLQDAEKRLEVSEKRLREAEGRLAKVEAVAANAAEAAATAQRLAQEGGGRTLAVAGTDPAAGPDEKKAEIESLLTRIREGKIEGDAFTLFQRARELGALEQAVAEMEKYTKAHADDPDAWVDLSGAYVARLLQAPDGPERGAWSNKSMGACDMALKIDPEHWGAQFTKAMNLSRWPAFLGRQPEAIKGFEKLIEQQERSPADPKFAQTYFQLGNTYREAGNVDKARDAFRRGLERYPEDKGLRDQLELLEKK